MSLETTDLSGLEEEFDRACSIERANSVKSAQTYQKIILRTDLQGDEANALKEKAIYQLAEIYTREGNAAGIKKLLVDIRPFFLNISKAKTGKIIRTIIDKVAAIGTLLANDNSNNNNNNNNISELNIAEIQIELCSDCIEWCNEEKRTILKLQIETKLSQYYLDGKRFQDALKLINKLVREVKRLDDKRLLVEVHLIESRIQHALRSIPKAKASLTASRAAASTIYVGPMVQAEIDLQAGALTSQERDYKTAYSYFYEAFEGLDGLKDVRAPQALKYMLLCKIMNDQPNDVFSVIQGKLALKYSNNEIEAMKAVAKAYSNRSLHEFENVVTNKYYNEIQNDFVVKSKLRELSDKLLEQNLQRLLEPYQRVEIAHIAKLIDLPVDNVQRKLSQMILDKKFNGILDQGEGAIIVFEEQPKDKSYQYAIETIDELNDVVEKLFDKAKELD